MPVSQKSSAAGARLRLFAMCLPGLGRLLADELADDPDVRIGRRGNDGRNDVVCFTASAGCLPGLLARVRLAEDVFAQTGYARRADGDRPGWLATRLCHRTPLAATSGLAGFGCGTRAESVRVVARVLSERAFTRTELRRAVTVTVSRVCPQWMIADPADREVWVCEIGAGMFVAGMRLTGPGYRHHDGRLVQRRGALRPSVAAAMIRLAGPPAGLLVDPCCGTGTLLAQARSAGWPRVQGFDVDPVAVAATRANVPDAVVLAGDARRLGFPADTAGAWVSNVPFGLQYQRDGDAGVWLRQVLAEAVRVLRPGGRLVVLAPSLPRMARPPGLRWDRPWPVRLLGVNTTIWAGTRG